MNNGRLLLLIILASVCLSCTGCSKKKEQTLKVAASAVPHAEMLTRVQKELAEQGINLDIIVIDDYNIPNRALADKEIDANFFQHAPFMMYQVQTFHYPIMSLAKIHIEPMGLYSTKVDDLSELPEHAIIAIPNDPTNEARALALLAHAKLITLDNPDNLQATVLNITSNPKQFKFEEIDAAMLPRTLNDVDASVIPTHYALQAGLSPLQDALIRENSDSHYANIIAIRIGDENRKDLQALKKAMTSEKMRQFILENYKGAIVPAF